MLGRRLHSRHACCNNEGGVFNSPPRFQLRFFNLKAILSYQNTIARFTIAITAYHCCLRIINAPGISFG